MTASELTKTLNKIKELILIEPRIAADMITLINTELERETANPPMNILRWILNIILIIILFALLLDLLGWVNIGTTLNQPIR